MKCLVKAYDTEQINNLISILAFKPRKVIFLYDGRYIKKEDLDAIEMACIEKIQNINFEFVKIDSQNLDDVITKCKKIIRFNKECVFDITGGEELSVIGMYLACIRGFVPAFKLDIDLHKFINVYGCSSLAETFTMPELDLNTILISKGARIISSLHPTPDDEKFGNLLSFCNAVFSNIPLWKELCTYIQNGTKNSKYHHKTLTFNYHKSSEDAKVKISKDSEKLLDVALKFKLINELKITQNSIEFLFSDENTKKYMTDFGSWLEIYSYITLKQSGLFKDVRMSVKIGWDIEEAKQPEVVNEVDVTFFSGIVPIFLSCKLLEPNTEALQELSIYPNYFGGKRSKCILVTRGNVKCDKPHLSKRAHEMGISIIDRNDITSEKFIKKISDILS